jgi:hypothetical protein
MGNKKKYTGYSSASDIDEEDSYESDCLRSRKRESSYIEDGFDENID